MIWFILAVLFFILYMDKKNALTKLQNEGGYDRGYVDGYNARIAEEKRGVQSVNSQKPTIFNQPKPVTAASHAQAPRHVVTADIYPTPKPVSVAVNTPVEPKMSAAEKAKHDLQNINTTLYVASFLLVAAAALFVSAIDLSKTVRFMGVWLVTLAFYFAGLILYKKVEKLRPAAVAFVGTGLALLPFTGFAMFSFILPNAPACWFITSLIGLVAFVAASVILNNQVIAYLAIAFGASLAVSSIAILNIGFIWYFVVLILFGSFMTVIASLKPSWVPECFSKPVQQSNQWIVPLTIVGSLMSVNNLTTLDYAVISLVSAIYYGGVAASSLEQREVGTFVARFLATLSVLLFTYHYSSSWTAVSIALSICGVIQLTISTLSLPKKSAVNPNSNNEVWLWLGLGMQLFAPVMALNSADWAKIVLVQLLALFISSLAVGFYLRRVVLSVFATIALIFIPVIWGLNIIVPPIEYHFIALIFIVISSILLCLRSINKFVAKSPVLRQYIVANFAIFLVEALAFTFHINIPVGWGLCIWIWATALVYVAMWLERQPVLSLIANGMILVSVIRFIQPFIEPHLISLMYLVLSTITVAVLAGMRLNKYSNYKEYWLINLAAFVIVALGYTFQPDFVTAWGLSIWVWATLLVYSVMYIEKMPALSFIANGMILVSVIRFVQTNVDFQWISLMYLGLSAVTLLVLYLMTLNKYSNFRQYWVMNFVVFLIESILYSLSLNSGWSLGIWLSASILVYALTYVEKQPISIIAANILFLVAVYWFIDLVQVDLMWRGLVELWISGPVFYLSYWLLASLSKNNYAKYFWWSAISLGVVISLANIISLDKQISIWASVSISAVSVAIIVEGWLNKQLEYVSVGVILGNIGLQRILYVVAPDTNFLVYTHWWALVFALLSYIYYKNNRKQDSTILLYIGLSLMTIFTGAAALGYIGSGDVPYQVIFILEHIVLLIAGLIASKKVLTTWGAVAAILAVLWMLRNFGWVLLAFAGIALIAAAIYALMRQNKNLQL